MSWTHPRVRGGFVVLLFLAYPWAVSALSSVIDDAAMMLSFVPVIATALLYGSRVGVIGVMVAAACDYVLARWVLRIQLEVVHPAGVVSLAAQLLLTFAIGSFRRVWLRLGEVNQSLAEANQSLAEEARLRSQMAAELEASAALHSSLLASMVEGVGLFDAEDRFVYANPAAEQLFSAAPGRLAGQCFRDLVDAEGAVALEAARGGQPGGPVAFHLKTRGEHAEPRHLLVTETVVQSRSTEAAPVLRVMHDVTVRERLEREQRELAGQVQRAHAVQSLGVLAGGVAHDFNNLLTGVLGNAELAMLRIDRASPEEVRHSLREIQDFAREAAALAKQMLAYAGKGTLATEVLSVAEVAEEAMRLVHSTLSARASLEHRVAASLPNVRGDRTQLRQIVVNLIMNAVEALGETRGAIRLTIDAQHFGPDELGGFWRPRPPPPGQHVVLTVSDNGRGMSAQTLSQIFDPFFSTKVTGRGMGLAATLGIVQAHGGAVAVESRPGAGSTFRVLLTPVQEAAGRVVSLAPPKETVRGEGLILLIDDERAVRSTASQMLEELGYRVLAASTGRQGLNCLAAESGAVRLVLLDLTMPDMDGRDTLTEMRKTGYSVPVLLISGYHHGEVTPLLEQPGVVGFLQKPLQMDRLARRVREVLVAAQ